MARLNGFLAVLVAAAPTAAAADIALPPPAIIAAVPDRPSAQAVPVGLLMWLPGRIVCTGERDPSVQTIRRPLNRLHHSAQVPASVSLRFAIDDTGRPLSIAREGAVSAYAVDEIVPAFAASRFAPGRAAADCTITYEARFAPISEAPLAELVAYGVQPQNGPMPRAGWDRIGAGGDCHNGTPLAPLLRAYPDFANLPATPGVRDWMLTRFDVDANGKPINLTQSHSTGNRALEIAARDAIARSRFAGAERTGCTYPYHRAPGLLAAPPPPPVEEADAGPCASKGDWVTAPRLIYPRTYGIRAIEGWAVLSYDVAPWGAIGNVAIVAAQPTQEFGGVAKTMLERARRPAGAGATGCRTLVRYVMKPDGSAPASEGETNPS